MKSVANHQDVLFCNAWILLDDIFPGKHEDLRIRFSKTYEFFAGYFFDHIGKSADRNAYISFRHWICTIRIGDDSRYVSLAKKVNGLIQSIHPIETFIVQ